MNNYISILLDELKGVFSEKDKIYFSGSSLKALIDEIEGLQTKVQLKNDELDDKDDKIIRLESAINKLYEKTRSNPEMWDTDGMCFILDDALSKQEQQDEQ